MASYNKMFFGYAKYSSISAALLHTVVPASTSCNTILHICKYRLREDNQDMHLSSSKLVKNFVN